jgi:DNA-binding NarL/FixJ family response regulator
VGQTRELSEATALLSRRRDLLLTVRKELVDIEGGTVTTAQAKHIQRQIDSELTADEQQSKIDEILREVEQDYIDHLSSTYPMLSKTEIIVCVFLKLGMRSIDIAKLMVTSERTVENHRLHIRKKMGLGAGIAMKDALEKLAANS